MAPSADSLPVTPAALAERLADGDVEGSRALVHAALEAGAPEVDVLDLLIAPAMHEVGDRWSSGALSVADEHLATTVAERLVGDVLRERGPLAERPRVLLATTSDEQHALALHMCEAVLHAEGYHVLRLGARVPREALVTAVRRHRPALVGLSATMPAEDELQGTLVALADAAPATGVLVGGAGSGPLAAGDPLVAHVPGMRELPEAARHLLTLCASGARRTQARTDHVPRMPGRGRGEDAPLDTRLAGESAELGVREAPRRDGAPGA